MRRLGWTIALLMAGSSSWAQHDYTAEFRAIPIWPAQGLQSVASGDRFVYLDPASGQMVIAYPENLGKAESSRTPGAWQIERFDLNNQAQAAITAGVRPAGKYFEYTYQIANAARAKQEITSLRLVVPQFGDGDAITAPTTWKGAPSPSSIHAIRHAIGRSSGVFVSWYSLDWNTSVIAPGTELAGFSVMSTLKPGISVAYVHGGGFGPKLRESMPQAVLEQAVPVLQVENNSQNVWTIAPRFSGDTPMTEIARDFQAGISQMIEHGQLDSGSPAIREAQRVLSQYAKGTRSRLTFNAAARPGVETEVLDALKLSLSTR
jgi:hypothetical protein